MKHLCALTAAFLLVVSAGGEDIATAQNAQAPANPAASDAGSTDDPEEFKDKPLPLLGDMPLPTMEQLLHEPPVDWIVLHNDKVLAVEPVYPRPDTVATLEKQRQASFRQPLAATEEGRLQQRKDRRKLEYIEVVLPGESAEPDYRIHYQSYVVSIIHHEDLMLRRVDALLKEKKLDLAFELLFALDRRHSGWPGYAERFDQWTLLESRRLFDANRPEAALVTLENLHERTPDFSGLRVEMGKVADRLIGDAVAGADYRRARYFLKRLAGRQPDSDVVPRWSGQLLAESNSLLDRSLDQRREKRYDQALELAVTAARIWPANPRLTEVYDNAAKRFQKLEVGVVRSPGRAPFAAVPNEFEHRHRSLTRPALFEVDRIDQAAHYHTLFFEDWVPENLGRHTLFHLRQDRPGWRSQQVVTAGTLVSLLARRLDPADGEYNERFAGIVDSVEALSPFSFAIRFRRPPARIDALLSLPLPVDVDRGSDGTNGSAGIVQPFHVVRQEDRSISFRRTIAEPDAAAEYHVAEVTETAFDTHEEAVRGLLRGEVSMLTRVPPWNVDALRRDERFVVRDYALPTTHVLQFNPRSMPLRSRQLRRAFLYALNRQEILGGTLLGNAESPQGRLVSAPFASKSHGYNAQVEPAAEDLSLAIALLLASQKELGGELPVFRMHCPPDPLIEDAARKLCEQWSRIGLNVSLAEEVEGGDADVTANGPPWDIVYRTVRMAEPALELWPFLALERTATIESLAPLPDWLRQRLIALDSAADFKTSSRLLQQLHAQLAAEVATIPLWEIDDVIVLRKNIRTPVTKFVHAYQDMERWVIQPWFPPELP